MCWCYLERAYLKQLVYTLMHTIFFLLLSIKNLSKIYVFGDTSKALNVQRFWRRKDRKSQCQQDSFLFFGYDIALITTTENEWHS